MAKRKPLSKTIRFEVFKRDSFTCQYCGRSAPDVVLEVDHIHPVSKGGTDDFLNLVTSCKECNRGKAAKSLDDNSVVVKQRAELERLEQLQMMIDWRRELLNIIEDQVEVIDGLLVSLTGSGASEIGKQDIKRLLHEFGFNEVYISTKMSYLKYYERYGWGYAFNKIGGICHNRRRQQDEKSD